MMLASKVHRTGLPQIMIVATLQLGLQLLLQVGATRDDWDTYLLAEEVLDAMGCLTPGRPRQSLLRFFRRVAAKSAAVMLPAAAVPKRFAPTFILLHASSCTQCWLRLPRHMHGFASKRASALHPGLPMRLASYALQAGPAIMIIRP